MSKIAFVGNFQYNCGSSNTVLGYVKAGRKMGYDIRISEFGSIDSVIRNYVPIAEKDWQADLLVIIYESYPFLSDQTLQEICDTTRRSSRLLIDPDGKYLNPISNNGDTNHSTSESYKYKYWTSLYDSLTDKILQPFLEKNESSKVYQFLYFGIDTQTPNFSNIKKEFDLLYVGNNWYRWTDIKKLINKVSCIRDQLKNIALIGQYWTGKPMKNFEEATRSDSDFLARNKIEIHESAKYGEVEKTMSRGKINPVLIRPLLNSLKFVTPRMFETFAANTVPLIPNYFFHAATLYGEEIKELMLSKNVADDILRIMESYDRYVLLTESIRKKLQEKHSYEVRIKQLLDYL